ncbi:hypothetical protein C8F04DRAFT_1186387 [Mycena alexandri]|uniref:Uncharacterized protein n=1 Tax=Mycena alexandri TaxID=1745969 RepID=A0AAD6WXD1_9AGAR|nr:hypothetical protein C8F04DRAFT_1186387 [Mycena alexandri]
MPRHRTNRRLRAIIFAHNTGNNPAIPLSPNPYPSDGSGGDYIGFRQLHSDRHRHVNQSYILVISFFEFPGRQEPDPEFFPSIRKWYELSDRKLARPTQKGGLPTRSRPGEQERKNLKRWWLYQADARGTPTRSRLLTTTDAESAWRVRAQELEEMVVVPGRCKRYTDAKSANDDRREVRRDGRLTRSQPGATGKPNGSPVKMTRRKPARVSRQ